MLSKGLLVRLKARPGMQDEIEQFLLSAVGLVHQEPATLAWFAVQGGRSDYAVVDFFPDDAGRDAHLKGAVAEQLMSRADELFSEPPMIQRLDVLASKVPGTVIIPSTRAILLTLEPKQGHDSDIEQFLRAAKPLVEAEPETTAWFAVRFEDGRYAIFDVFPDNGARFKHLIGKVPQELAKNALHLLGGIPDLDTLAVLAEHLAVGSAMQAA
jgi:quinol monooxygenase YgiN